MNNSRKTPIIMVVIFLILIILSFIIYSVITSGKPQGKYLEISNLEDYTKDKPVNSATLNYIKETLYKTVNLNLEKPVRNHSVKDVVIREGSFSQEEKDGFQAVHYIVDIKSLNQSYNVKYSWATDNSKVNPDKDQAGVGVFCLPIDQLIYGDFKCKDLFNQDTELVDPIFKYLPHSTLDYEITYNPDSEEKMLIIKIMTSAADERSNPTEAINTYRNEALNWLGSLEGINPNDYKIQWQYSRASLY